jgi:hypothetical protein
MYRLNVAGQAARGPAHSQAKRLCCDTSRLNMLIRARLNVRIGSVTGRLIGKKTWKNICTASIKTLVLQVFD